MIGLVLDASSVPHVVFHDGGAKSLRYATILGGKWRAFTLVGGGGDPGWWPALARDAAGKLHIQHRDAATAAVHYLAVTPPDAVDDNCDGEL